MNKKFVCLFVCFFGLCSFSLSLFLFLYALGFTECRCKSKIRRHGSVSNVSRRSGNDDNKNVYMNIAKYIPTAKY